MGVIKDIHTTLLHKLVLFVIFMFLGTVSWSQDRVIENVDGQDCFVHLVEKGHTLYSLSKLYNVSLEQIEAFNPQIKEGLKLGNTLYIPVPDTYNEENWTNPIRIEDGRMIHRVMKKETLYGISKKYGVDINDLLAENPGIELGLDVGEELKIPQAIPNESIALPSNEPDPRDSLETHIVSPGETLYSISKSFGYRVEELIKLNPGAELGLIIGQVLYLPEFNPTFQSTKVAETFEVEWADTLFVKDFYVIKILLPFSLGVEEPDKKQQRLRDISMSFYRGCMMALDSLQDRGAHFTVEILDCAGDSQVDEYIKARRLKDADLIIGPLQKNNVTKVAKYTAVRGIHLVCPTLTKNSILLSSPNLSKVQSSEASHMKELASYIAQEHKGENIILINSKDVNDARKVQLFKKYYRKYMGPSADSSAFAMKELEASSKFVGDLEKHLAMARRNILVVPAGKNSKSMIANLQTKLQLVDIEQHQTIIYGTEDWFKFEFLEPSFKNNVSLRLPTSTFVDYTDSDCINFVKQFRRRYATDPTDYGFLGYDVALFYGQGLIQYGKNFPNKFDMVNQHGMLHLSPKFSKSGLESGFENESATIISHENQQITVLNAK